MDKISGYPHAIYMKLREKDIWNVVLSTIFMWTNGILASLTSNVVQLDSNSYIKFQRFRRRGIKCTSHIGCFFFFWDIYNSLYSTTLLLLFFFYVNTIDRHLWPLCSNHVFCSISRMTQRSKIMALKFKVVQL